MNDSPNQLSALMDGVDRGMKRRGFFLLMDERIDLICGARFDPYDLAHLAAIHRFASKNNWSAVVAGRAVTFSVQIPELLEEGDTDSSVVDPGRPTVFFGEDMDLF